MDHIRNVKNWKILCWNVRGINSVSKWDSVRDKIVESGCDIVCLQETKRESFDLHYIKNFCPPAFDTFEFLPSVGASGGIITIWKSLFLKDILFSIILFCNRWIFVPSTIMLNGYQQISMALVLMRVNILSWIG